MTDTRVFYAIGDIHGLAERLGELHTAILTDASVANARAVIVHLGDYVDRGPDSFGVIERVRALEAQASESGAFDVVSLRGNHEQMMIDAANDAFEHATEHWAANGGDSTVASYLNAGRKAGPLEGMLDAEHLVWLQALPTLHWDSERRLAFVHGGIDPEAFPNCRDEVRMWTRSRQFFDTELWPDRAELTGLTVVHGHTPTDDGQPEVVPLRINVDTGAVYGGPLTCVVLAANQKPRFLYA